MENGNLPFYTWQNLQAAWDLRGPIPGFLQLGSSFPSCTLYNQDLPHPQKPPPPLQGFHLFCHLQTNHI